MASVSTKYFTPTNKIGKSQITYTWRALRTKFIYTPLYQGGRGTYSYILYILNIL